MAFRTFVRLSDSEALDDADAPAGRCTQAASAIDIARQQKAAGSGRPIRLQFNRALLRAERCGGRAEEASKVTIEVRLVTEARVAAISANDKRRIALTDEFPRMV